METGWVSGYGCQIYCHLEFAVGREQLHCRNHCCCLLMTIWQRKMKMYCSVKTTLTMALLDLQT